MSLSAKPVITAQAHIRPKTNMSKYQASLVVMHISSDDKKCFFNGCFHCFNFLKAKKRGTPKQCPYILLISDRESYPEPSKRLSKLHR